MATEDKIVENMGVVSDKLVQYMDAAEKVISQYGGDAVNLGLNVLRIEAAQGIAYGVITAILAIICYKMFPKGAPNAEQDNLPEDIKKLIKKGYHGRTVSEDNKVAEATGDLRLSTLKGQVDWDDGYNVIIGIVSAISGFSLIIAAAISLFDVWNWVGVFWPEAYAVHKFLM